MGNFKYIIIPLLIFLCFITVIFAEGTDISTWDIKCDNATSDGTKDGCWNTVKYCEGDEEKSYTGCFYDKNNPDYSTTKMNGVHKWTYDEYVSAFSNPTQENFKQLYVYEGGPNDIWFNTSQLSFYINNDIPAQRAYAAVDGNSKVATLVCYKGYAKIKDNHKLNTEAGQDLMTSYEVAAFDVTAKKCEPGKNDKDPNYDKGCIGPVFIFKLFQPASKTGECTGSFSGILLGHNFDSMLLGKKAKDYPDIFPGVTELQRISLNDGTSIVSYNPTTLAYLKKNGYKLTANDRLTMEINKRTFDFTGIDGFAIAPNDSYAIPDYPTTSDRYLTAEEAECPFYFHVNPTAHTSTNRYRVSNKLDDNEYDKDFITWLDSVFTDASYDNGTSYKGCTSNDEVGYEEMEKCFLDAEQEILKKACPQDVSNFEDFTKDLEKYQTDCKERYKQIYAKFKMKEDNKDFDAILKKAKNTKIDECFYKYCKLTDSEINSINNELKKDENKNCKDGCVIKSKFEYSSSPNAKCWGCVSGSELYYTWTDSQSMSGSCHPETSISKENCFGTTAEQTCIKCLKNVYTKLNLSEDKIKCMDKVFGLKEKEKKDTDQMVDDQSTEYTNSTAQQNAEAMSDTFSHHYQYGGLDGKGFGSENQQCVEIVGVSVTKIIKTAFDLARIIGAIIAIVNAMVTLIPAVTSKNADGLKKAAHKCVIMAVVLAAIGIFPSIVRLIASLFGYDITCLI